MLGSSMAESWLLDALMRLIPLVLSLTVHEWAHAYSAHRLGDDTAARQGRLTLDPMAHIDPLGTLLLPLLGVPFGWARPVPVNPARFTRKLQMRVGMMITAAAGPLSNVVLAVVCIVLIGLFRRFELESPALSTLLANGFQINVLLALFNMLPIPPLDGSRVADGLMPRPFRPAWERFAIYGPLVLLGVIAIDYYYRIGFLSWPLALASAAARSVVMAIAGL